VTCDPFPSVAVNSVGEVKKSSSVETDADSSNLANVTDEALAKELDRVVAAQPLQSKTSRLQNLFTPQGRFIMSTLQDIQEEQQRLSSAIAALKVPLTNRCLLALYILMHLSQSMYRPVTRGGSGGSYEPPSRNLQVRFSALY